MKTKLLILFIVTFITELVIMLAFNVLQIEFENFWLEVLIDSFSISLVVSLVFVLLARIDDGEVIKKEGSKSFVYWLPAAMFITISISSGFEFFQLHQANIRWETYLNGINTRQILLSQALSNTGYTGFIHNFKNFVLRRKLFYYERAKDSMIEAKKFLKQVENTQDIPQEELKHIKMFEQVLDEYHKKMNLMDAHEVRKRPVAELDKLVKVNDSPSVTAIKWLVRFYQDKQIEAIGYLKKTGQDLQTSLAISFLFANLFILFLAWQLFRQTQLASNADHKIEKMETLNAIVTTFNHEINNPLTIAQGFLNRMTKDNFEERQPKVLESLERITKIVKTIDEISQQEDLNLKDYTSRSKMLDLDTIKKP